MRVLLGKLDALEQFANRPLLLTTSLKGHHLSWYVANVIYGTLSTHGHEFSLPFFPSTIIWFVGILWWSGFFLSSFLQRTPLSPTL